MCQEILIFEIFVPWHHLHNKPHIFLATPTLDTDI